MNKVTDPFANVYAVLFDIGGTLLDFDEPESLHHLRAGIDLAYDHLDHTGRRLPAPSTYRRKIMGQFLGAYLWSRLRGRELNPMGELESAHRRMHVPLDHEQKKTVAGLMYQPIRAIARARQATVDAVAQLKRRGYALGIVSNTVAPPCGLDDHLAEQGLLEHFPVRIYSCEAGVPKPDPRIFERALAQMKVNSRQTVYVGDKPRIDVRGARRAGMRVVLRLADRSGSPPRPAPDRCIEQIPELLEFLLGAAG